MRKGISITVTAEDRVRLDTIIRNRNNPQKHVWRARIVVLTADGEGTTAITRAVGTPFDVGYELSLQGAGCGNMSGATTPADSEYFAWAGRAASAAPSPRIAMGQRFQNEVCFMVSGSRL